MDPGRLGPGPIWARAHSDLDPLGPGSWPTWAQDPFGPWLIQALGPRAHLGLGPLGLWVLGPLEPWSHLGPGPLGPRALGPGHVAPRGSTPSTPRTLDPKTQKGLDPKTQSADPKWTGKPDPKILLLKSGTFKQTSVAPVYRSGFWVRLKRLRHAVHFSLPVRFLGPVLGPVFGSGFGVCFRGPVFGSG